jgi:hypothetical protein
VEADPNIEFPRWKWKPIPTQNFYVGSGSRSQHRISILEVEADPNMEVEADPKISMLEEEADHNTEFICWKWKPIPLPIPT